MCGEGERGWCGVVCACGVELIDPLVLKLAMLSGRHTAAPGLLQQQFQRLATLPKMVSSLFLFGLPCSRTTDATPSN